MDFVFASMEPFKFDKDLIQNLDVNEVFERFY